MSKTQMAERVTEDSRPSDIELLRRTPLLANIRTDCLLKLLEGAQRFTYETAGQLLELLEDELYIVVKGALELRRMDSPPSSREAPDSSAHVIRRTAPDVLVPLIFDERPLRHYEVRTSGETTEILCVKDSFWPLFEQDPDFQRAILRQYFRNVKRESGALLRPTPFGRKASPSSPPPILVLRNGTGKQLPLGGLADLLAASVARQFQEHVRVLHLRPDVSEMESADADKPEQQVWSNNGRVSGWVKSEWLPLPKSSKTIEDAIIEAARSTEPETWIKDEVSLILVNVGDVSFIPTKRELDFIYFCDESICSPHGLPQELVRAQHSQRPLFDILYTALLPESGKLAERERTWPLGTVRLRFESKFLSWLGTKTKDIESAKRFADTCRSKTREKELVDADGFIDRWARAVTGRRVGVALGGGGAYGYVHIALLRELCREKVPVEMVSGSSFGTLVGAFYATQPDTTRPEELLCDLENNWSLPALVVSLGLVSNRPMAKFIDWRTGNRRLDELDLPMFPVVADADAGSEWDLRGARIGDGIRASAALPPSAPAIIEDRTYLDGGVVANVPVHVLQDEGAGLVIASNCITSPHLRTRWPDSPWLNVVRETLSSRRLQDLFRITLLMMRGAGNDQAQRADVVYEPPPSDLRNPAQFRMGPALVEKARVSIELKVAVEEVLKRWEELARHGLGTVRLTDEDTLVVEPPLRFTPDEAMFQTPEGGTKADELPGSLRVFLANNNSLAFTLEVPGKTEGQARGRAFMLKQQLVKTGISPYQISMMWKRKGDEEVRFRDVRWLSAELRSQLVDADSHLRNVTQLLEAGNLVGAWSLACDIGKQLKTRTAQQFLPALEPSLRQLLAVQGRPLPLLESQVGSQAFYLVWCDRIAPRTDDPSRQDNLVDKSDSIRDDWLAIGGDRGIQLWTGMATGNRQSSCYSSEAVSGLCWHPSGRLACTTFNALCVFTPSVDPDLKTPVLGSPVEERNGGWERWGTTFSADGSQVLSSTGSRNLVRYPAEAPSKAQPAYGLTGQVKRAVMSPTGGWTAAVTMDGNLLLWHGDLTEKNNAPTIFPIENGAECLEWHPRDDVLAVGTRTSVVLFDQRASGDVALRSSSLEVPGPVRQVAWSPRMNGTGVEQLAVLGADVRIWNVIPGSSKLAMILQPETGSQIGMQWHPGGEHLAIWNAMAIVWNVESGRVVARYGGAQAQLAMGAWSPTGRYLALCSRDGKVFIWEPCAVGLLRYSHEKLKADALDFPIALPLRCVDWHPADKKCVASASADGSVQLWNPTDMSPKDPTWSRLLEPVSPPSPAFTAWSSGGQWLATVRANELVVWSFPGEASDFTKREPVWTRDLGFAERDNPTDAVPWLRWSSDKQKLAVCNGWEIQVWDVGRAEPLWTSKSLGGKISWANWTPDGKALAVAVFSLSSQLVICSEGLSEARSYSVSSDGLWDVVFSPDGERLAIGSNVGLEILDTATYKPNATFASTAEMRPPTKLAIRKLAWSPDGKLLAICNDANKVDILDTETWSSVASSTTKQPVHKVTELLWRSGEGDEKPLLLLISTEGGEVLAWSDHPWRWDGISTMDLAKANGMAVDCLSLSPDGRHLVISGAEGIARVLPMDAETLLTEVEALPWMPSNTQVRPLGQHEDEGIEVAA